MLLDLSVFRSCFCLLLRRRQAPSVRTVAPLWSYFRVSGDLLQSFIGLFLDFSVESALLTLDLLEMTAVALGAIPHPFFFFS